eukprot:CAMPEP_0202688512 /NCGR_PEP_ID=MMETSP1385-20130828/4014_1 /ASSEMBLY_ACC=CAM_ASM_000861 /TAXON_ID=933848 /ORGANISM="Elphidium margaritaceum" /LENGTH=442 /DNA_ID=CAMNT_0049343505 /DNA_START=44 /DNA_END=1372 /DNA_ORIENTATION=+
MVRLCYLLWLLFAFCQCGEAKKKKRRNNKNTAKPKNDGVVRPGSSASHHLPIEEHHSFRAPFDVSMPYWTYGGSTVCTDNFIRLTPATQSRAGWLINEFELQSTDWEIELQFEVRSDYHIGGDGFGIFVLNDTFHPRRNKGHNYLTGSIFGLTEKFQGFGVVFDTYDNDGNRDNPTTFVLKQEKQNMQTWNHNNDFADNLVKETPGSDAAYHCSTNYRNDGDSKVILRYIGGELHVYIKTNKDEFEYCLSVKIGLDTRRYYIAFTAMTGQVADRHDLLALNTRYLDGTDAAKIDDRRLKRSGYRGRRLSWKSVLFWLLITILNVFLIYEIVAEAWEFSKLQSDQLAPVILCQRLNDQILVAYWIHIVVMALVVLAGRWSYFLINAPFVAWRAYQFMTNNVKLEAIKLRKLRNMFDVGQPIGSGIKFLILLISIIMSIINIFS